MTSHVHYAVRIGHRQKENMNFDHLMWNNKWIDLKIIKLNSSDTASSPESKIR